jgi:phage I-like protein
VSVRAHRLLFSELAFADPSALPTEFRIFRAGANPSTKGTVIFDDAAAASVMAAYSTQGVDLPLDLEHQSLDAPIRPDSTDARGWFKLEVRNGELWAVDLRLTPDGTRRLSEKTQKYTSPAFYTDEKQHVTELINVALVAMPATHQAAPLVAASKRGLAPPTKVGNTVVRSPQGKRLNRMNPEDAKAALEALKAEDGPKALALLEKFLTEMAGGAPAAEPGAEAMADTAEVPPKPGEELAALTARLTKLEAEKAASVQKLSARVAELEAEKAAEENAERVKLVAEHVTLGRETPATAWAKGADGSPDATKPAARFVAEPIADLRERTAVYRAAGPAKSNADPAPAPAAITLSKDEQAYCTKHGLTPEAFQARKAKAARTVATAK